MSDTVRLLRGVFCGTCGLRHVAVIEGDVVGKCEMTERQRALLDEYCEQLRQRQLDTMSVGTR